MTQSTRTPLVLLLLVMGVIWAGCDAERGLLIPNEPPNTRVSAGPPEASDTEYRVNLFWFGWDDDGFVDHYELAFDDTTEWQTPIFSNDSLFFVTADGSCCVSPLPQNAGGASVDSIYEQFHTFFVRAVDNLGVPDPTPSVRSFNAKTIAPHTQLTGGPAHLGIWGSDVKFTWRTVDDDGFPVSWRYALISTFDYARETGDTVPNLAPLIAWVDTITYYPETNPGGGGALYSDSLVWRDLAADSITFRNVVTTSGLVDDQGNPAPENKNKIIFAVKATDNAGAEEKILTTTRREQHHGPNVVVFDVSRNVNGPCVSLISNVVGTWSCFSSPRPRSIFANQGIRFCWTAVPGGSGLPLAGFSYALDDTTDWSPFSLNSECFPVDENDRWRPGKGAHTFFIRAIDAGGFIRVLTANLRVFDGPARCDSDLQYIVVVLDTNPGDLIQGSRVFPPLYRQVEVELMRYFFEGYDDLVIHQTNGDTPPDVFLLDCASSTFWFHSTSAPSGGDNSVLRSYHRTPPNVLPSYVSSGGNLFIAGISPLEAFRFAEQTDGIVDETIFQRDPVRFTDTLADTGLVTHWMVSHFGIGSIDGIVDKTALEATPSLRFTTAKSHVVTGPNPYPDLHFDPLSWPLGTQTRGFGFYDRGVRPYFTTVPGGTTQVAQSEVIYSRNNTGEPVAVRRFDVPPDTGKLLYAGFHPYFLEKEGYREFLRAVLADFGEFPDNP
ncbi:MAG: hypothetical protein DHS20C21_08740 [Gemmatimonadota bacterium]|nr:MAG: hypothetical protein DHS20C21_08740 [Gemmatimonadota bacterium]